MLPSITLYSFMKFWEIEVLLTYKFLLDYLTNEAVVQLWNTQDARKSILNLT